MPPPTLHSYCEEEGPESSIKAQKDKCEAGTGGQPKDQETQDKSWPKQLSQCESRNLSQEGKDTSSRVRVRGRR